MTDPITDMLNRIRNAQAVDHISTEIPFSNMKYEIACLLAKNGFIESVEKKEKKGKKEIEVKLKYEEKTPVISGARRISKPGQRIYQDYRKIKRARGGYGITVVSTSKGIMTGLDARKNKIGGEILFEIW